MFAKLKTENGRRNVLHWYGVVISPSCECIARVGNLGGPAVRFWRRWWAGQCPCIFLVFVFCLFLFLFLVFFCFFVSRFCVFSHIQSVSPIALVFDFDHFITLSDILLWPILHAMYASGVSNDSARRAHTHYIHVQCHVAGCSCGHTKSAFPHDGGIFWQLVQAKLTKQHSLDKFFTKK